MWMISRTNSCFSALGRQIFKFLCEFGDTFCIKSQFTLHIFQWFHAATMAGIILTNYARTMQCRQIICTVLDRFYLYWHKLTIASAIYIIHILVCTNSNEKKEILCLGTLKNYRRLNLKFLQHENDHDTIENMSYNTFLTNIRVHVNVKCQNGIAAHTSRANPRGDPWPSVGWY